MPFPLDAEGRCALCRFGLRGFDAAYCFGSYEGVLRELIHLYKYGRVKTLARPLGALLAAALPREERFDAVTPVPLHWRRQWQRGFNQSELLARTIARRCGIPVIRALRRVRPTVAQAGLSNTGRRQNVAAAFRPRRGAAVERQAHPAHRRRHDHRFHGGRLRPGPQARGRGQGRALDGGPRGPPHSREKKF
jgi:predicted amidophosphoribosyltransferase